MRKYQRPLKKRLCGWDLPIADFQKQDNLPEDAERLRDWLDQGYHARMGYMANHFEKRTDPTLLVEGARSVISLLFNYYTDKVQQDPDAPVLSKYAYGKDYHFVMKEKMNQLFDFIKTIHPGVEGRVFVDSAPVLDRAWARKAGLGWIGKNSNLISRKAGSFVFIGETHSEPGAGIQSDSREAISAEAATVALMPVPPGPFWRTGPWMPERCISYQTIENKGDISPDLEGKLLQPCFWM